MHRPHPSPLPDGGADPQDDDLRARAIDRFSRPLEDFRISLIDRCNLRCGYCMPAEIFGPSYAFLPHREWLDFSQITQLVEALSLLGLKKVRLTGGEPLLRPNLAGLVELLRASGWTGDLALTTNGLLLDSFASPLRKAGLDRVTVSLDALDDQAFLKMSGGRGKLARVIDGIDAAIDAGLHVKINSVIQKGSNDCQLLPLATFARARKIEIRFIEFMDVGNHNAWSLEQVLSAAEMQAIIARTFPFEALPRSSPSVTSERFRYLDSSDTFGLIASVTRPFCGACSRARLSADGKLFTCLFASSGHDLRPLLSAAGSSPNLAAQIAALWGRRDDRASEIRDAQTQRTPGSSKVEMSYIGG
jgi:GTP 3',8-cyclase